MRLLVILFVVFLGTLPLSLVLAQPTTISVNPNAPTRSEFVDNSTDQSRLLALAEDPSVILVVGNLDPERIPQHIKSAINFNARGRAFIAPHLESVGDIHADEATAVELPALKSAGEISAGSALSFKAPELQTSGPIHADRATDLNISKIERLGSLTSPSAAFDAPELETSGNLFLQNVKSINTPKLREAQGIYATNAASFNAPLLQKVGEGGIGIGEITELNLPLLESAGAISVGSVKIFNLPKLEHVTGMIFTNASIFSAPLLRSAGDINVDKATIFNISALQTSKDIKAGSILKFDAPELQASGKIAADQAVSFNAPKLETAETISVKAAKNFDVPKLRTSGDISADSVTHFSVPELQHLMGDAHVESAESFDAAQLEIAGDIHASNATSFNVPKLQSSGAITAKVAIPQVQRKCPPELIERFVKNNRDLGLAQLIAARHDASVLPQLEPMLADPNQHVRETAAYIFASFGDQRGFDVITAIINDRTDKPEYHGPPGVIMDVAGGPSLAQDHYFAVHLLGDLKDKRSVPLLVSLLDDEQVNYLVPWTLGEIGGKEAEKGLLEALKNKNPDVRVTAILSIAKMGYREALPNLHSMLDDHEKSHFGRLATVSETAQDAIVKLEASQ